MYCQQVGKPNQRIPPALLIPHVPGPFTTIECDVVDPLPKTPIGHGYLCTIMNVSTRYIRAVAFRKISAKVIIKVVLNMFTDFDLPNRAQTDGASYGENSSKCHGKIGHGA